MKEFLHMTPQEVRADLARATRGDEHHMRRAAEVALHVAGLWLNRNVPLSEDDAARFRANIAELRSIAGYM